MHLGALDLACPFTNITFKLILNPNLPIPTLITSPKTKEFAGTKISECVENGHVNLPAVILTASRSSTARITTTQRSASGTKWKLVVRHAAVSALTVSAALSAASSIAPTWKMKNIPKCSTTRGKDSKAYWN